jgi:hypothetical protein
VTGLLLVVERQVLGVFRLSGVVGVLD